MSDTDTDIDERDRELAATIRAALRARAHAVEPAPRECPSPAPRRSATTLVGVAVAVALVVAALVAVRIADDGSSDPTQLAATGDEPFFLPGWLPDGVVLQSAQDPGVRMDDTMWMRVYRPSLEPGSPLITVSTQRGSTGVPVETTIAGLPANVSTSQFGGLSANVGLECGSAQVQAENLDRAVALAAVGTLYCSQAGDSAAAALALPADYKLVYDAPFVDIFPDFRWKLNYESPRDASVTLSFGVGADPSWRFMFMHPLARSEAITVQGLPATLVTIGSGFYLSWRESTGFVELDGGGVDQATLVRIAESLRRVSEGDFRAATRQFLLPTPTPPVFMGPSTVGSGGVATGSAPSTPQVSIIAEGQLDGVPWSYGTSGQNECFAVGDKRSCGSRGNNTGPFLTTWPFLIEESYYFFAFGDATTDKITVDLPGGVTQELQRVGAAPDGDAVFFGAIRVDRLSRIAPTAILVDRDGTRRTASIALASPSASSGPSNAPTTAG